MIQEIRCCPEIIRQLTALSHAAGEVSLLLLRDHIEGCVADAVREQRGEAMTPGQLDAIRGTLRA